MNPANIELLPEAGEDFIISTSPNDAKSRFEIEIKSSSANAICIHTFEWPFAEERWSGQAGTFEVHADGKVLEPPDENPGSCIGPGCYRKIHSKSTARGYIKYSVFGNADFIAAAKEKSLIYNIAPFYCKEFREFQREIPDLQ